MKQNHTGVIYTVTTSPNPEEAKIVSLIYGLMDETGNLIEQDRFLFNPETKLPEEITRIHGITPELIETLGVKTENNYFALKFISRLINVHTKNPLIIPNANYTLKVLNNTLKTAALPQITIDELFIIDPTVADKHINGQQTLKIHQDTAPHYGLQIDHNKIFTDGDYCELLPMFLKLVKHPKVADFTKTDWALTQKQWVKPTPTQTK